ncbi:MAG: cobyric acid synthase, partial [Chloroflexi bacterium]|nr:cobyric acid synthase [Chloroflexota bacterium]
ADAKSQVVVMGKPWKTVSAHDYYRYTPDLLPIIEESLGRLRSEYDVVVIEGAGSPAEINLQRFEIVNMKIAELAQAPVLLVGDIEKGGVFASLVGTVVLLGEEEKKRIQGFIINKFRGDVSILQPGLDYLEEYTGIPVLGVVPYYHDIVINEEDSVHRMDGENGEREQVIDIAVIHLPRISNSTDFEPLQQEQGVRVRYVTAPWQLDSPDLIIVPGSKSTMNDLAHMRDVGLAQAIMNRADTGTPIIGICGGFQMLGRKIEDPQGIESDVKSAEGLGLLDITTIFEGEKATHQVKAKVAANDGLFSGLLGEMLAGYEIHMGQTMCGDTVEAFEIVEKSGETNNHLDGAVAHGGHVFGTYMHGIFDNHDFRRRFLRNIKPTFLSDGDETQLPSKDEQYDRLAELTRQSLDIDHIYRICGLQNSPK